MATEDTPKVKDEMPFGWWRLMGRRRYEDLKVRVSLLPQQAYSPGRYASSPEPVEDETTGSGHEAASTSSSDENSDPFGDKKNSPETSDEDTLFPSGQQKSSFESTIEDKVLPGSGKLFLNPAYVGPGPSRQQKTLTTDERESPHDKEDRSPEGTNDYTVCSNLEDEASSESDEENHFPYFDAELLKNRVAEEVNIYMRELMQFLENYEDSGKKHTADYRRMNKTVFESTDDLSISGNVHAMVNRLRRWEDFSDPLDRTVARFAEEIIAGRIRHLVLKGYIPDGYKELYEKTYSYSKDKFYLIFPRDKQIFELSDKDFERVHKLRTKKSKKTQNLPLLPKQPELKLPKYKKCKPE